MMTRVKSAAVYTTGTGYSIASDSDNSFSSRSPTARLVGFGAGAGACSAAVASYLNGRTGRSVDVNIELGTLHIDWAEDNHVYMTGPAEIVFTGEIHI